MIWTKRIEKAWRLPEIQATSYPRNRCPFTVLNALLCTILLEIVDQCTGNGGICQVKRNAKKSRFNVYACTHATYGAACHDSVEYPESPAYHGPGSVLWNCFSTYRVWKIINIIFVVFYSCIMFRVTAWQKKWSYVFWMIGEIVDVAKVGDF